MAMTTDKDESDHYLRCPKCKRIFEGNDYLEYCAFCFQTHQTYYELEEYKISTQIPVVKTAVRVKIYDLKVHDHFRLRRKGKTYTVHDFVMRNPNRSPYRHENVFYVIAVSDGKMYVFDSDRHVYPEANV